MFEYSYGKILYLCYQCVLLSKNAVHRLFEDMFTFWIVIVVRNTLTFSSLVHAWLLSFAFHETSLKNMVLFCYLSSAAAQSKYVLFGYWNYFIYAVLVFCCQWLDVTPLREWHVGGKTSQYIIEKHSNTSS